MYLMCIPKCILDSFGIRVKYNHAKCQDTCILLECNRACKIHLRYIRIEHSGYMYPSEYMQDTSGYVSYRKLPPNRIHVGLRSSELGVHHALLVWDDVIKCNNQRIGPESWPCAARAPIRGDCVIVLIVIHLSCGTFTPFPNAQSFPLVV